MEMGNRLRRLRQQRNLTQEEMANRCELSKGFISQVENNLTSPSIATLTDMIECLGTTLKQFFSESAQEKIVYKDEDMFEKEDEELLRGRIVWLVPNAQKNQIEPMMVTLGEGGRTAEIPAHEGEEFGYVLSGKIILMLGQSEHPVSKGESFCLHPDAPHHIYNPGKREAVFLWVSTPPSF